MAASSVAATSRGGIPTLRLQSHVLGGKEETRRTRSSRTFERIQIWISIHPNLRFEHAFKLEFQCIRTYDLNEFGKGKTNKDKFVQIEISMRSYFCKNDVFALVGCTFFEFEHMQIFSFERVQMGPKSCCFLSLVLASKATFERVQVSISNAFKFAT